MSERTGIVTDRTRLLNASGELADVSAQLAQMDAKLNRVSDDLACRWKGSAKKPYMECVAKMSEILKAAEKKYEHLAGALDTVSLQRKHIDADAGRRAGGGEV